MKWDEKVSAMHLLNISSKRLFSFLSITGELENAEAAAAAAAAAAAGGTTGDSLLLEGKSIDGAKGGKSAQSS